MYAPNPFNVRVDQLCMLTQFKYLRTVPVPVPQVSVEEVIPSAEGDEVVVVVPQLF